MNQNKKTLNILGVEYKVVFYNDRNFPKVGYDGLCNSVSKTISIRLKKDKTLQNEVLRHEIIHAFFHESGLTDYENDEVLVEWVAMQFPKMKKVIANSEVL